MTAQVRFTAAGRGEYPVLLNSSHYIGVVKKYGMRYRAISPTHDNLGSFTSMSQAAERLVEEDKKNVETPDS